MLASRRVHRAYGQRHGQMCPPVQFWTDRSFWQFTANCKLNITTTLITDDSAAVRSTQQPAGRQDHGRGLHPYIAGLEAAFAGGGADPPRPQAWRVACCILTRGPGANTAALHASNSMEIDTFCIPCLLSVPLWRAVTKVVCKHAGACDGERRQDGAAVVPGGRRMPAHLRGAQRLRLALLLPVSWHSGGCFAVRVQRLRSCDGDCMHVRSRIMQLLSPGASAGGLSDAGMCDCSC